MSQVVLLGPQRNRPNLSKVLTTLDLEGPFAVIAAGWQEREDETGELEAHLEQPIHNLYLHRRGEEIFKKAPEFRQAHREHQNRLKRAQELYRIRLDHSMAAIRALMAREKNADASLLLPEIEEATDELRRLDSHHESRLREMNDRFEDNCPPEARSLVMDHHYETAEIIEKCKAVIITGGHVAVLLNRLRLLKLAPVLRELPVIAWSGGAMVLAERLVLFHDNPPQGKGNAEILESGLGLYENIVPLPQAAQRLHLDDQHRVRLFANRFEKAACITLDEGSHAVLHYGTWQAGQVQQLSRDGQVIEWEGA